MYYPFLNLTFKNLHVAILFGPVIHSYVYSQDTIWVARFGESGRYFIMQTCRIEIAGYEESGPL